VEAGFETVGALYNACKFRAALVEALALATHPRKGVARQANGYTFAWLSAGLARKAPWFQIKADRQAAATMVYVILRVIDNLKTLISPVLPHSAQKTHESLATHPSGAGYDGQLFGTQHVVEYQEETRSHEALTYDHTGTVGGWAPSRLPAGQALRELAPLFRKLDEGVIEEETARLGGWQKPRVKMRKSGVGVYTRAPCCSCSMDRNQPHSRPRAARAVLEQPSPRAIDGRPVVNYNTRSSSIQFWGWGVNGCLAAVLARRAGHPAR
jgi:hypothetical protein